MPNASVNTTIRRAKKYTDSLGLGDEVGSLESGKWADFVIHDCEDYRELGYLAGIEHPFGAFVKGKLVARSARGPAGLAVDSQS
jgi:cytosine/adenosine deaminase-related metal-dependent hydrolase